MKLGLAEREEGGGKNSESYIRIRVKGRVKREMGMEYWNSMVFFIWPAGLLEP